MTILLVILACLLWGAAFWMLSARLVLAPALSFLALLLLSLARSNGLPLVPLNTTMLTAWLCITLVVTAVTAMQPAALLAQTRGMGYLTAGSLAGMAVGLAACTLTADLSLRYALMVGLTAAGTAAAFLLYSRTPQGRPVAPGSGVFFKYLLAKGFPTAITVMQLGVVLVLALATYNVNPQ